MSPRRTTDFLVSSSSFFTGAGTVINLAGNFFDYNESLTPEQADTLALWNDWAMIGQDMQDVMALEFQQQNWGE